MHHLRDETAPTREEYTTSSVPPADRPPSLALLERLSTDQRTSFLPICNRLPSHMREIAFELHGLGWTPTVITQLGDVLAEFSDKFSKSPTGFWLLLPAPLKYMCCPEQLSRHISVLPHQFPHRKAIERDFGQIPRRRPHPSVVEFVIPKKSGGIRITVAHKKMNELSVLDY